ncbi:hypothetical protein P8T57_17820 [Thalassospira sp. SN3W]|uniref:hypothetical protein n=1 Tax=Thalassospira sp. SN3W TaxID=3035476 RepID=UPI00311B1F3D
MKVASKHLPHNLTFEATGPSRTETTIKTTKQLYDWSMQEIFWRRNISKLLADYSPPFIIKHNLRIERYVEEFITTRQLIDNQSSVEDITSYAESSLFSLFGKSDFATYNDKRVIRLQEIIKEDRDAAWLMLLEILSINYHVGEITNFPKFMDAQIFAKASISSIKIETKTHKSQLTKLKNNFENSLYELSQKFQNQINHNEISNKKSISLQRKILTIQKSISKSSEIISHELIEKNKEELNKFKEAYSTEMKLRAGEALWRHKKHQHRKAKNRWFISSTLWIIFGLISLSIYYTNSIDIYITKYSIRQINIPVSLQAVIFLAPTIIYAWVAKIFLSNYRKNQAQEDDAEERQTMVMTYKALEYDGKRTSNEERALILNALFRSKTHNSDDALPSPIWETVLNRLSKNS